jgi:hypothetical protein
MTPTQGSFRPLALELNLLAIFVIYLTCVILCIVVGIVENVMALFL